MVGNGASEKELKLLEIIREKNERIEQLEILNESLQKKVRDVGVEAEPLQMDAETSDETERKAMKGEKDETQGTRSQNQVDSEISTVEAVVIAPEILLKILKNMKTRDLLEKGRLVNRKWRDLSTDILLKRKKFQIKFGSDVYGGEFIVGRNPSSRLKLEQLITFLSTSKTFPCAHFIFDGNVKSADAQAFLSQFGSRVKGIKLIGPQNLSSVRNLLVEKISRLKTLELSGFVPEGTSTPGHSVFNLNMISQFHQNPGVLVIPAALPAPAPAPVPAPQILTRIFPEDSPAPQLPFLVSLKLGEINSPSLVQEILKAAPNLKECFGIRTNQEIETLRSRIHVVKGLKMQPVGALDTILVNDLDLAMQLHLISLELDLSGAIVLMEPERALAFCNNISNILHAIQGSLKKLKLTPYMISNLNQWPQLELRLSEYLTRALPFLFAPLENKVSRIFPNLHTLHLKKTQLIQDEHTSIFKLHSQISTVKCLKISRPIAKDLEMFVPLFPNIARVLLAQVKNFDKFAPIIWQMKGLKSLEIEFDCEGSEIDAGFTGMEKPTCTFLRAFGTGQFQVEQLDKFRVRPSILEAKELEQLFLPRGFSESEEYNSNPGRQEQQDLFIATCVSFKYAFNLMPKLRVFSHRDQ